MHQQFMQTHVCLYVVCKLSEEVIHIERKLIKHMFINVFTSITTKEIFSYRNSICCILSAAPLSRW